MADDHHSSGLAGRLVEKFLESNLGGVLLVLSLAAGFVALNTTPREEEPQIVVPLADVHVSAPDLSAEEVELHVATPLERLLYQIDGVEHVYSVSRTGGATVIVRFHVGQDREDSFTKLSTRLASAYDQVPPGVTGWIVKPIEIDDVSVLAVALASPERDDASLRRVGEEVLARLETLPDISRTEIIGGATREIVIEPRAAAMAARGITLQGLRDALRATATDVGVGAYERDGRSVPVFVGSRPAGVDELGRTVVAVHEGGPVYLSEVARITDGPAETATLVRLAAGPALARHPLAVIRALPEVPDGTPAMPAVTLSIAKKKGTNAVTVAEEVTARLRQLVDDGLIPPDVGVIVTRDLGYTSDHKVGELVEALWVAIATVVGLIAIVLGFREGLIVAVAVPVTFAITLFVNELAGYTINRVTLFALILSLGLVVDDPIVDVENISRHLGMKGKSRRRAVLDAVNEVRPPIILATLAVIVSFLPMFFITGMMGPYMGPMALNVPLAMISSLLVAFTLTPWMCDRLLKPALHVDTGPGPVVGAYRAMMAWFLARPRRSTALLFVVVILFFGSVLLALTGAVPLKMLPFDNKDEFQVLVDLPDGTSLAATDRATRDLEARLLRVPEVTSVQTFTGLPGPLDFNGLVRHVYFRTQPHQADVRVTLVDRKRREASTHELVLGLREDLTAIAIGHDARIQVLETPPGPPVVATVTVEVRGGSDTPLEEVRAAARALAARLEREPGVVDVDTSVEDPHDRVRVHVNERKAALAGIDEETVAAVAQAALSGAHLANLRAPDNRSPVPIVARLPRWERSGEPEILSLPIAGVGGTPVRLHEIATIERTPVPASIHHKDLERVVFVYAETAGRSPADVVFSVRDDLAEARPPVGTTFEWAGEGELQITFDVFRDLGLAFAAALMMIYILLLAQMKSWSLPLVVMSSIPLTMIGIFPGFALLNLLLDRPVGGFDNPVFFSATAMIGMIALAGIVVRNAIMLVEFLQDEIRAGRDLRQAVINAGAVRFRPVLMTAGTTLLGAWPITLDPIFSGLAWALIFGLLASTAFTLLVVPVAWWKIHGRRIAAVPGTDHADHPAPDPR